MIDNKQIPTPYGWAVEKFEKLTDVFYDKVLKDKILEPIFRHMPPTFKTCCSLLAEVLMGPKFYSKEYGADALKHMVGKHIGKKLEEVQRKRWVELLLESANEIGLPDDPEFRSTFVEHLEWGSRVAVINSQLDENPTTSQDQIPEWGWREKSKVSLKQLVHCSKEREMNNIQTICCF